MHVSSLLVLGDIPQADIREVVMKVNLSNTQSFRIIKFEEVSVKQIIIVHKLSWCKL